MNKFLDIIILYVCCLLVRAYSLFRLVLNCDVMFTDIKELTWQHKDTNFIFDWEKNYDQVQEVGKILFLMQEK